MPCEGQSAKNKMHLFAASLLLGVQLALIPWKQNKQDEKRVKYELVGAGRLPLCLYKIILLSAEAAGLGQQSGVRSSDGLNWYMFGIGRGMVICISWEASLVYTSKGGHGGKKERLLFQDQIIFIVFVANHPWTVKAIQLWKRCFYPHSPSEKECTHGLHLSISVRMIPV